MSYDLKNLQTNPKRLKIYEYLSGQPALSGCDEINSTKQFPLGGAKLRSYVHHLFFRYLVCLVLFVSFFYMIWAILMRFERLT
jgi:hypothetical protein